MIGDKEETFEANLLICHNNQANGEATLSMSDGRTVKLTAVSAKSFFRSKSAYPAFAVVYTPHPDEHPDVGTFAPSPTNKKVYLVDLKGPNVPNGRVQFKAKVKTTNPTRRCETNNFGQINSRMKVNTPKQDIFPEDSSKPPVKFGARIAVWSNNAATGFVKSPFAERSSYSVFFGAFFSLEGGDPTLVAVGVDVSRPDPFNTGNLITINVKEDDGPTSDGQTVTDPDCLLWDLMNDTSGLTDPTTGFTLFKKVRFDAEKSRLRVFPTKDADRRNKGAGRRN